MRRLVRRDCRFLNHFALLMLRATADIPGNLRPVIMPKGTENKEEDRWEPEQIEARKRFSLI